MTERIKKICDRFSFNGNAVFVEPTGCGHINDTFRVVTDNGSEYLLQRMNHNVFEDIDGLMKNVAAVTDHIKNKILENGGNPERECLTIIPTVNGKFYINDTDGCWRAYIYIKDTKTLQTAQNAGEMYSAGLAFGRFQSMLDDYPAGTLNETIPDFHNTPKRYQTFLTVVAKDSYNRVANASDEIAWVKAHKGYCSLLTDKLDGGEVPIRVTHNDTKINNCMLDAETGAPLVVIDLDTVMPGLAAYDFGDAIRFGATLAAEDETDLSKVKFELDLYEGFAKGFLMGCGKMFTKEEVLSLPLGCIIMTLECGMRFLTDYLDGDRYFKTKYKKHNLDRCRTQFALADQMIENLNKMNKIVLKHYKKVLE